MRFYCVCSWPSNILINLTIWCKMSFKRDGDDLSLLNRLKHQRVADLLGNYIPDEEAKLLSNGRFTCLVCVQRPIFDTINMLSIHRKGKKHLSELSKYIKRKSELELEMLKKEQKDSLNLSNNEDSPPALGMMNSSLLVGHPKEHLGGKYKRKLCDNIRRKTLEIPSFMNEMETMKTDIEADLEVVHGPSAASQVRHYLKQLPRKMSLEKSVEMKKENCDTLSPRRTRSMSDESLSVVKPPKKRMSAGNDLAVHMSGWIKDKFGNWIKDPNAEFDTDDDEPPNLPT